MPYISQEEKKTIANSINPILKSFGLRGTLSIRHNSQLVLTIRKGGIDFVSNFNKTAGDRNFWNNEFEPVTSDNMGINEYHYKDHFSGVALEVLSKLIPEMKGENFYDNTDISADFFDIKHYINVKIGTWEKPYILV